MSSSVYAFSSDFPDESGWDSSSIRSSSSDGSIRTISGSQAPACPEPDRVILSYSGYLKYPLDLTEADVNRLRRCEELNDRGIDVLLAIAHADAVEKGDIGENDVVVLPTAFEESFQYVKDTPMPLETFARAHERIKKYHSIFWGSRLILVPLQRGGHWFLAVITNAQLAQARNAVQVPPQEPNEGDSQPDQHPFGILILNSWVRNADVEFMAECLKGYLAHSWNAIQGGKLQYVYTYYPKCPRQMDGVSCGLHIVRNAEIMMELATAEKVRKGAQ
ncbi:hypothetical protein FRC05_004934 [Tulasnella sp. 425]|nr:hypothetical protein FRC05_004934 [Tulasnella sp. 425]